MSAAPMYWTKSSSGTYPQHAGVRLQAQRGDQAADGELGMLLANEDHPGAGMGPHQLLKGPQGLGDALIGFEEPEDADQGRGFVHAQAAAVRLAVDLGNGGSVGDDGQRPAVAGGANLRGQEPAMDDDAAAGFQQPPVHGQAFVVGPDLEGAHAPGVGQGGGPAVVFGLLQVGVPIALPDGGVGHQVVEVEFMQGHDAGLLQIGAIGEDVVGVVADLVERQVEVPGAEGGGGGLVEDLQREALGQPGGQGRGVVGDSALLRGQGREKGHAHPAQGLR